MSGRRGRLAIFHQGWLLLPVLGFCQFLATMGTNKVRSRLINATNHSGCMQRAPSHGHLRQRHA